MASRPPLHAGTAGRVARSRPAELLIWGAEDGYQPLSYAERFAREVPSAEPAVVAGAGHIPMEDDPARVAEALLSFLEPITITEEAG